MPDSHLEPGTMAAGGYYSEHSEAQGEYGELGIEWLEQAAGRVPAPDGGPLVIADLGAAGGANSLKPLRRAIAAREERRPGEEILVVHTDIASNDFTALFELIASSPDSYLRGAEGVHALAAGRSFYERLFPPAYLSLAWSSIAVHWLSEAPVEIAEHIYCSLASESERAAFAERSATDWDDFLAHRAIELIGGGRMVIVGGAALDDGTSGAEGLMEIANGVLLDLCETGELGEDEYRRMTIPTWNRTEAEFTAPFGDGATAHDLELARHTLRTLPDPYFAAYSEDGDLDTYVAGTAAFFEAAFGPSLWAALDPERGADATTAIQGLFDRRLRGAIGADPDAAACTWHVVVLELVRR